ncbi:hypothetical protein SAMN05216532_7906 [Streptomyces sp. 2231.1]|uniref:hypothetical protein n=1 Tax=Streptomyces sp. 2231.1 TaxID=1855347 RepID=UPI00089AABC4|nr:hypothetical protein [Streptomyces sp. 2231.1]SEE35910.1 hypothetical protein SAMN05216532_7906 [Streptomyces sp. 2231.1]
MRSSHEAGRRPDGRAARKPAPARIAVGLFAAALLCAAASVVVAHGVTEHRHGDGPGEVHVFAGGPEDWNNTVSQPPPKS